MNACFYEMPTHKIKLADELYNFILVAKLGYLFPDKLPYQTVSSDSRETGKLSLVWSLSQGFCRQTNQGR